MTMRRKSRFESPFFCAEASDLELLSLLLLLPPRGGGGSGLLYSPSSIARSLARSRLRGTEEGDAAAKHGDDGTNDDRDHDGHDA